MQQTGTEPRIPREIDPRTRRVEPPLGQIGPPVLPQSDTRQIEPQTVDIGPPSHCDEQQIDLRFALRFIVGPLHRDGVSDLFDELRLGVDDGHLRRKRFAQAGQEPGVGQPADRVRGVETGDLDAEAGQRLPKLQPDGPEPDHGHAARQMPQLEDIVRGQESGPEPLAPPRRHHGARSGRDDRGPGTEPRVTSPQHGTGLEYRGMRHEMRVAPVGHAAEDFIDKDVAQFACLLEHPARVDPQSRAAHDPQRLEIVPAVKVMGRLQKRLGRHARHPRATGAMGAGVEYPVAVSHLRDLGACREPGGARADDRDVDFRGGAFRCSGRVRAHRRLGFVAGSNSIVPIRRTVLACGPMALSPVCTTSSTGSRGCRSSKLPSVTLLRWK